MLRIKGREHVQATRTVCRLRIHGLAGRYDDPEVGRAGNADAVSVRDFLKEKGFEVEPQGEITKDAAESFYAIEVVGTRADVDGALRGRFPKDMDLAWKEG